MYISNFEQRHLPALPLLYLSLKQESPVGAMSDLPFQPKLNYHPSTRESNLALWMSKLRRNYSLPCSIPGIDMYSSATCVHMCTCTIPPYLLTYTNNKLLIQYSTIKDQFELGIQ